jgi:hypothetical protein
MKTFYSSAISIFTFLILSANHSFSQETANFENRSGSIREIQDDPYLPNQYDNKKVSPGYKYDSRFNTKSKKNNFRSTTAASSIYTIQVNVNSNGQNITGDAGNEPSIAINHNNPNQIAIGWRQFDNVASNFRLAGWSYSSDAGQTWTFPGVIEPGVFRSDPVLDYDNNGKLFYNSLTADTSGNFFCSVYPSLTGGASWDAGVLIGGGDKQWMTVDRSNGPGDGNIYSAWTENYSSCLPGFFTRSPDDGASYEPCEMIDGSPFWGTEAVGNDGELYIVGASQSGPSVIISKSSNAYANGTTIIWDQVSDVFIDGFLASGNSVNPQGLLGQVHIDIDRSNGPGRGNVYVLSSVIRSSTSDPGDVMFIKSSDGGTTWSNPIQINDDSNNSKTQWLATLSVAPNGRIDAVWLDTREDFFNVDSSALYYSYSIDQGSTWSVNEKLSGLFNPHVGYPNQNKMGDYFDMISDDAGAHLAWAGTMNGEEDVYYSYIVPGINVKVPENPGIPETTFFPNPTGGKIFLRGLTTIKKIEIYNSMDDLLFTVQVTSSIQEVDLSFFASGIYFMKLIANDGNNFVKKIIKN